MEVSLGSASNATVSATSGTGTGTITDDDGAPTVSINSPSVTEGDSGSSSLTFTVSLSAASAKEVTVGYSDAGTGDATSGTDYTALTTGTLTFAAGDTSETVTVSVTGDTTDEPNETVEVRLGSASNAMVSATSGTGTGTITDDDGAPTVSINAPSVNEGDSGTANLTFTVSLSVASAKEVTVGYSDAGTGDATSGTDYTALTAGTLTFGAGTTSRTFDVSVTGDVLDESNETVEVSLGSATNAAVSSSAGTGTGTITDDDAAPTSITLTVDDAAVGEGDGATTITVTAAVDGTTRFAAAKTIRANVAGSGTATAVDFAAVTAFDIRIAAGAASGTETFTLTPTDDTEDETDETLTVSGASGSLTVKSATISLTDDDGAPTLSISSPSVNEGDSGSANLTFTVSLDAASAKEVTVGYSDAGTGDATSGTDYTALTAGTLTFAAGDTSETITVSVTGDTTDEPNETVKVGLGAATNAAVSSTSGTGTGTITDDDGAPTVSINAPSVTEGDSGSANLTFTVSLSVASGKEVTVGYSDAGTGDATSGTDYTALPAGTLTFAAGDTSETITVSVTGDTTDETNETVEVRLGSASNATVSSTSGTGTGTITDDDGAPTVSINSPSVTEGDSGSVNLTFTVSLDAESGKQVTVRYADATTGTAAAGTDYTAIAGGTLTFAAGTTSRTFDVSVTGDVLDESNETILVSLSAATNAAVSTAAGTGTGTITDDDGAPGSITLTVDDAAVGEGDGATPITVTATVDGSTRFAESQTVRVSVAGSGMANAVDFGAVSAFDIEIAAGAASGSASFTLTPTDDAVDETDETITVSGASGSLTVKSATISLTDDDGAPSSITLTVDDNSVGEGDGATTITVKATVDGTTRFSEATTVRVSVAGSGTATAVDFAAVSAFDIGIGAGAASGTETFTLTPTDDAVDETDETITVSGASGSLTVKSATISLTDDDGAPSSITLTVDDNSVGEGDGATPITVKATVDGTTRFVDAKTVRVSVAGSGMATAVDFAAVSAFDIEIAGGAASGSESFTLTPTDDAADETDETITVSGASGSLTVNSATISLTDDDGAPTLSINDPSVNEGDSGSASLTFTVTLSAASAKAVTVGYSDAGTGDATSGTDYAALTAGTLTFAAGDTSETITVSVTGDTTDEANETVEVRLGSASNATVSATSGTGTGTITDDDGAPTVSINSPSVDEGDSGSSNLTFTVSLSAASAKEVTVGYSDAGTGDATSGTDYTALTAGTLTFAAGDTSETITVSVTGDTTDEANETVEVRLGSASNATVSAASGTGTGTITDDDGPPTVSINSPSVTEGDSGSSSLTFTVSLSAASAKAVTVGYSDAGTGDATSGTDYTALTAGTLTFGAGTTSRTFDVSVTGDVLDESNETILVLLSAPTNAVVSTTAGTGTGTITDDDGAPTSITLTVDDAAVGEGDGAARITVNATVDGTTRFAETKTVRVSVAGSGTETAVDFAAVTAFDIEIAAGAASGSGTFTLTPTDDAVDETDETITVSGASGSLTVKAATISLTDDDGAPTAITLTVDDSSVGEGAGATTITVTATVDGATRFVDARTVRVSVAGSGTATAVDFAAVSAFDIEIGAGAASGSGTFTLTPTDDAVDETDETITVSGTSSGLTVKAATISLTDDDGAPTLSINSPSVDEGDSGSASLTFTVTLSAESSRPVTVQYADAATGTATSGTDYTAITGGTLTFAAGTTSRTFDVSVTGDTTDEANETVAVTLSGAANAIIGTATGTGTITDDDGQPTVALALSPTSITESGATNASTVTATLNRASAQDTTITVSATAGTNADSSDFTLSGNRTLTIAAGSTSSAGTVTITAVDNGTDGNDKSVTVSGAATNTQGVTDPSSVTLTITDDDGAPSLSIDSPSVSEGDTGSTNLTFTVTLAPASDKEVRVDYADAGSGDATSGTDYTALTAGTLTFVAGDTSKTITVSVTGDTTDEPNETVAVTLSGASNATVSATSGTGTGTITDDDDAPTVSLALSRTSITESGATNATTVTARLDHASSEDTTITVSAAAGTNADADDFTLSSNTTLTISAGSTSSAGTVTITAADNGADEDDRSVTVSGAATNTQGVTDPSDVTLTITDDDGAPSLSIDSPSVSEGDTGSANLTFTVTLAPASDKEVTVDYADAGSGDATSGTDYTALTAGTLTFAAGDTSRTITVSVTGDTTDEPNEAVAMTLSGATNATVSATSGTGTGTITDDDDAPTVSLALSRTSITESGATNATTVTASLDHASSEDTTITVSAAAGTNAETGDFTPSSNKTLTITAGSTSSTGTVTITAVDNGADENDKSVTVSGAATNTQGITDPSDVTLMITDDDSAPSLSIDSPSVSEGDTGSANLTFTVTLAPASDKEVTVDYADAGSGNATSGTDYTALTAGTLTFAAGDTSRTITVSVTGDTTDEPNETVAMTLSGATNATVSATSGTGTITDDDDAPTVSLTLSRTSITESGATNATTVTARLDHASSEDTTITVSAAAGTNADSNDFTPSSNKTLTITAGSTSSTGTVTITAVDNSADEDDRSVTVSGAATNSQGVTDPSDVTLTITDDDGAPSLSIDSPSVSEGDTGSANLTFTVTLAPASDKEVTVDYADAGSGTAASGMDYTALTAGTLTFAAGETSKTIAVSVIGDETDEPDQTIEIELAGATNAAISTAAGTGTITDDDDAPSLTISDASVTEGHTGSTTMYFLVNPDGLSEKTITVNYADAGTGSATSGTDYAAVSAGRLTFVPGNVSLTVAVTITGDTIPESDETIEIELTGATNASIAAATAIGTITDDDDSDPEREEPDPELSIDSPSVLEGNDGSAELLFTVTLSGAATEPVTVAYTGLDGGTATAATDYTAPAPGTLVFAVGERTRTIPVVVFGDEEVEADETVLLRLSAPQNAVIATATGIGTIRDDDGAGGGDGGDGADTENTIPRFAAGIPDQVYRQNTAIIPLTLPEAVGGAAPLTYALTPGPPAGLGVASADRALSGTPATPQPAKTYHWTATDDNGDTATLAFSIEVREDLQPTFPSTGPDLSYRVGRRITPEVLPAAVGGDGPLTYALTPSLPRGLGFTARTRTISGVPAAELRQTTFTLTATDADGDAASLPFTLRAYPADPTPGFAAGIPDQTYRQNTAITPLTLPEAVGGAAPLTYALTPGPPAGLGVASADRVLSGTPVTPQPAKTYHWTATDDNGDAATLTFSIEVREDLQPTFPSTGPDLSYRIGRRITPEILPAAVGGDGPLTYALTPSLPRGLGFTPATRTISGAPAAEQRRTTYLLTATDADGDAASLSFTLTADTVDTIPRFAAGIPDQTYRQNTAIAPLTLPEAVGGVAPLTYALTPGPPAGLGVASADRVLSGTPVTPQPARTYHWTATDDNGDAATLTFSIEVREDLRPTFPSTGPDLSYRVGRLITPEALPAAVGGDGPLTYALTPSLPRGLGFTARTRTISGVPAAELRQTTFTLTATDADGDTASLPFTLAVTSGPVLQALRLVSRPENGDTYFYGEQIRVEALFSEPVVAAESSRLALTIGMDMRSAELVENGGRALRFTYTVDATDHDPDGISVDAGRSLMFRARKKADAAGNEVVFAHAPLRNQSGHRVDGAPQAVGTLPPLTLALGGEPARVDIGDAFHAAFRHAVTSTAPEIAEARLEETTVVVTPRVEGRATILVTGENAGGSAEQRFEVTVVTAQAERQVVEDAVAGFGRSLLSSASATVGRRLLAGAGGGPAGGEDETDGAGSVTFSGLPTDDRLRLEQALETSRAFTLSATRPGGARWTVWGAGDLQSFRGEADIEPTSANTYEGRPLNNWLGVDVARGGLLAGLAVSRSGGDLDYAFSDLPSAATGTGRLNARLFQVHPYLSWQPGRNTRVWGQAGLGRGSAELTRSVTPASEEADLDLMLGLAGLRRVLGRAGRTSLALRADLGGARLTASDGGSLLDGLASTVYRGRLGLELTATLGAATPFVEFGGRYDGGAGATGAGLELAGGLRIKDAADRLGVEARGRVLALHTAAGYRESGFSLTASFTPQGRDRGLMMEVRPAWGAPAQGAQTLWQDNELGAGFAGLSGGLGPGGSLGARVSYGLGRFSPFTEATWSDALSRMFRAGVRMGRPGDAVDFEFTGGRSDRPDGAPDYRFDLYGRLRLP